MFSHKYYADQLQSSYKIFVEYKKDDDIYQNCFDKVVLVSKTVASTYLPTTLVYIFIPIDKIQLYLYHEFMEGMDIWLLTH